MNKTVEVNKKADFLGIDTFEIDRNDPLVTLYLVHIKGLSKPDIKDESTRAYVEQLESIVIHQLSQLSQFKDEVETARYELNEALEIQDNWNEIKRKLAELDGELLSEDQLAVINLRCSTAKGNQWKWVGCSQEQNVLNATTDGDISTSVDFNSPVLMLTNAAKRHMSKADAIFIEHSKSDMLLLLKHIAASTQVEKANNP